jgi:hypothetical protein
MQAIAVQVMMEVDAAYTEDVVLGFYRLPFTVYRYAGLCCTKHAPLAGSLVA